MNKLDIVKASLGAVVSIGVGAIVGNAVMLTTPLATKGLMKLCIKVGSLALSGMASDKAAVYVEETIDDGVEKVKGWFQKETPEQEAEETETT